MNRDLHVVVLMGGWSNEREVSLTSGARRRGRAARARLVERDRARHGPRRRARLAELKPDVVFNALHGTPGEDGTVQGMMDLMGLNYTHSGLETSVIAIDKELTKMVLVPARHPHAGGQDRREREHLFSETRWRGPMC